MLNTTSSITRHPCRTYSLQSKHNALRRQGISAGSMRGTAGAIRAPRCDCGSPVGRPKLRCSNTGGLCLALARGLKGRINPRQHIEGMSEQKRDQICMQRAHTTARKICSKIQYVARLTNFRHILRCYALLTARRRHCKGDQPLITDP